MGDNKSETAVNKVKTIGKIDIEKYQYVSDSRIVTDEVVLTDNRKQHIIQRRGQAFYDKYEPYFYDVLKNPDYIFRDDRKDTALVSKIFLQDGEAVNLVLRLAVENDNPEYKNSIITAIKENNKRFAQRLRNNIPVYKKVDKNEYL